MVAARNARRDILNWLEATGAIRRLYDIDGDRQQVWIDRSVCIVGVGTETMGTLLAECPDDSHFPTEAFIATVALGLMAHGVAIPERPPQREKSEAAKHVHNWKTSPL